MSLERKFYQRSVEALVRPQPRTIDENIVGPYELLKVAGLARWEIRRRSSLSSNKISSASFPPRRVCTHPSTRIDCCRAWTHIYRHVERCPRPKPHLKVRMRSLHSVPSSTFLVERWSIASMIVNLDGAAHVVPADSARVLDWGPNQGIRVRRFRLWGRMGRTLSEFDPLACHILRQR